MKSDRTIKRELRRLHAFIEAPDSDPVAVRVAYEVEQAIRWARYDVRGWPTPLESALDTARRIAGERPPAPAAKGGGPNASESPNGSTDTGRADS